MGNFKRGIRCKAFFICGSRHPNFEFPKDILFGAYGTRHFIYAQRGIGDPYNLSLRIWASSRNEEMKWSEEYTTKSFYTGKTWPQIPGTRREYQSQLRNYNTDHPSGPGGQPTEKPVGQPTEKPGGQPTAEKPGGQSTEKLGCQPIENPVVGRHKLSENVGKRNRPTNGSRMSYRRKSKCPLRF